MSVTLHAIPPTDRSVSTLKDVNEFFVPTILSFNLKKTTEDRLPAVETENSSSRQNGDIVTEENEDMIEMSPKKNESNIKRKQTSSFLLEPFLKPVGPNIETNKENPVLKALFGGRNPQDLMQWTYMTKTSINNCHPFKKTDLSHDLTSDDTPALIPRSLIKNSSKERKREVKKSPPRREISPVAKVSRAPALATSTATASSQAAVSSSTARSPSPATPSVSKSPAASSVSKSPAASSASKSPAASSATKSQAIPSASKSTSPSPSPSPLKENQVHRVVSAAKGSPRSLSETNAREQRSPDKTCPELSLLNRRKKVVSQSSLLPAKPRLQYINNERLIQLRTLVDNAIKSHKVYSMTGCYNSVRNALKQRGWIEKIDSDVKGRRKVNKFEEIGLYDAAFQFVQKYQTVAAMKLASQTNSGFAHNDQIHYTGQGEAEIINRMLKNVTEDLCWLSRPYPYYCWKDFDKYEMINRLPRAYFSNKVGLCNSLQQIQWFYETGICSTQFPRTYNMSMKDEVEAFKDDFRLTSCIGILKWFLQTFKSGGEKAVRSPDGKIDMNVIEFALRRCAEYVKTKQHEDIDIVDTSTVWEYQWDQFITQYYKIINEGQILKETNDGVAIKAVVSNVQSMLNIMKPYWPQFDIEGYQNFWIVKPGGRCCGAGILIKNNLEQIMTVVNPNSMKETRFVVQKYIERPLLIYNTKFDIRQWFLVTSIYPLTIWMYKESYLRFCSQPFTLKNTHESIHLCNNAVQRKYKNGKRDRGLPDENMWDCYTFQTYLKAIGHPDVWDKHIYPGMKEGFIGALLASQDTMERKKNCFELYGADFMVSDTLTDGPWLIEINSNPAMDSSTSVTARMCPQVLEDIIKVVIDRRDNKSASTGAFEMVFRQNCPPIPPYLGMSLCVKGKKAYRSSGDNKTMSRKSKSKNSSEPSIYTDTEEESTVEEIISVKESPQVPEDPKREASSSDEGNSARKSLHSIDKIQFKRPKRDRGSKRRKVDWVRKNIEDLKSFHSLKPSKISAANTSCGSSPRKQNTKKDLLFREQVLKLLGTLEVKQLLREMLRAKRDKKESERKKNIDELDLIIGGIEIMKKNSVGCLQEISDDCNISEDIQRALIKLLQICRQKAEGETIDINAALDEIIESCRLSSNSTSKSCPNFDSTFESELQKLEEKEERKSIILKSDDSSESFLSATSLSCHNSKTSLDYFRDWRSKLTETRRTCEDMLAKLHIFREENSKVKFQDALKKRLKDEVDFVNRIRQLRKSRKLERGRREHQKESLEKRKGEERHAWVCEEPLAINSQTGAVRAINDILPKIKQRSRPLLPKGSGGHGRKIDVITEQPVLFTAS